MGTMMLQGWSSATNVTGLAENDLRSLSGEGYALAPAAVIHLGFYFNPHAPWNAKTGM